MLSMVVFAASRGTDDIQHLAKVGLEAHILHGQPDDERAQSDAVPGQGDERGLKQDHVNELAPLRADRLQRAEFFDILEKVCPEMDKPMMKLITVMISMFVPMPVWNM